jgi:two-component SAPR family response regulator
MMVADMAEELGHRVVAQAGTIDDAGPYAVMGEFDLAILDINIGGFGVDPIAETIERRGRPFLFITGYGQQHLPSLFRRRPVLEKPVSIDKLRETINSFLTSDERDK